MFWVQDILKNDVFSGFFGNKVLIPKKESFLHSLFVVFVSFHIFSLHI